MESNGYGQLGDFAGPFNVGGAVSGVMVAKDIAPTPPMQSALHNIERSIHRLDDLLGQLAGRIAPVCRVEPPSAIGNGVETRAPRANSSIGSQVWSYADQIDALSARVSDLLNRCEL